MRTGCPHFQLGTQGQAETPVLSFAQGCGGPEGGFRRKKNPELCLRKSQVTDPEVHVMCP